jgi:hypothetical protein
MKRNQECSQYAPTTGLVAHPSPGGRLCTTSYSVSVNGIEINLKSLPRTDFLYFLGKGNEIDEVAWCAWRKIR